MTLQQLYDAVNGDPTLPYDRRLIGVMDQSTYDNYCSSGPGHRYYSFLRKLVRRLAPRKVLELGTSIGRSANFMLLELPQTSTLTTVDIGSHRRVDLANYFDDDRLQIIYGDDRHAETLLQVGVGFDLCFIDTEHSWEQLSAEWQSYHLTLLDGAVVVLDDIHLNDGMQRFWDALPYEKVDSGGELHFSGFGLFRYDRRLRVIESGHQA